MRRAAPPDSAARDLCGCGRRCRIASHGSGRASRHNRLRTPVGVQPRWVQTPTRISHSGLMARLASVAGALSGRLALRANGSGRSLTATALASAISLGVRRRTNSGWPRHFTTICWPSATGVRSTSIEDSASAAADGIHLVDKGPGRGGGADGRHRAGSPHKENRGVFHPLSLLSPGSPSLNGQNCERGLRKTDVTKLQAPAEGIARNTSVRAVK